MSRFLYNTVRACGKPWNHTAHDWSDGELTYRCLGHDPTNTVRAPRPDLPNPPGFVVMRDRTGMSTEQPLDVHVLVTTVTQLLAATAHDEACDPVTGCGCVIGDLERALPRCTATDPDRPEWACLSLPHADDLHVYGRRVLGATPPTPAPPMPNTGHIMAVHAVAEGIADVQDQLRELLSHLRHCAEVSEDRAWAANIYNDVAGKLAAILDGED